MMMKCKGEGCVFFGLAWSEAKRSAPTPHWSTED
jgi:hypothetical protein